MYQDILTIPAHKEEKVQKIAEILMYKGPFGK